MDEWVAVAASRDIGTVPHALDFRGVPLALVRLAAAGPALAFVDRCPHRLVPLSAGQVDGTVLRCPYHGWEFDVTGRCVTLPSGGTPPPRAALTPGPRVRESAGTVYLSAPPVASTVEGGLSNVDPALLRAWHPAGLSASFGVQPRPVTLAGRDFAIRRSPGGLTATPAPAGLVERWGLVWLSPGEPLVPLFDEPDTEDREYVGAWLPPAVTPAPAGVVADNFLDVAHFPFVHAATFGAGEEKLVPAYEVTVERDGCRSVQEQWFDNPGDPGVAAGIRPARQRRRATYVYRAPFQLLLRLEELDAGAVKTILFFAAPETLNRTRIYTKLLLYGIGGVDRPDPATVAREVEFEESVLAEDLALQREMTLTSLPLRMRDEVHVRADRLGVALRRELARFVAAGTP
jgi:phenylpropionate dioxygenase-like ring-hydroxylating dioxygenase large terminal subunit